jgi:hypothetical protein
VALADRHHCLDEAAWHSITTHRLRNPCILPSPKRSSLRWAVSYSARR